MLGPRGTGKSTWLTQVYPDAEVLDLLKDELFRKFSARPERVREWAEGNPGKKVFVIDEIQKVPQILDEVHLLIEKHKDRVFIMTGSSARKLRREGVNLLGGRAALKRMHPFMAGELGPGHTVVTVAVDTGLKYLAGDLYGLGG